MVTVCPLARREPIRVLEYESTVTYRLGSLVVKRPSSDRVVPGSNPGPVIFNNVREPAASTGITQYRSDVG